MSWSLPLDAWQREAVIDWGRRRPADYLIVATPGGRKTRVACAIGYGALDGDYIEQIVVVVPTTPLCGQWSVAAAEGAIQLDPDYVTGSRVRHNMHGIIVTYAQVIQDPSAFAKLCSRRKTLVVCDEIHHAGQDSIWGRAMLDAFSGAVHRVHLSGTPFRTNESKIAFLQYDEKGYVVADYVYPYKQALHDGIVRPVVPYPQGAEVKWRTADGVERTATFEDHDLSATRAAERLRAVLDHEGWIADVLVRANDVLERLRRSEPDCAGLAVTKNASHAKFVARVMRDVLGVEPTVVLSEDTTSDKLLAAFKKGSRKMDPWIVAVRKVSEGVDIPRLRVEAYLTNARTELLFRQIVGRIVRVREPKPLPAYLFFPSDPELLRLAKLLENEVKGKWDPAAAITDVAGEALGLELGESDFEVLDARHIEVAPIVPEIRTVDPFLRPEPPRAAVEDVVPLAYERARLRTAVSVVTGKVANKFGLTRKDIYGWWVSKTHKSIDQADEQQLKNRVVEMDRWLREGRCPVPKRALTRA